MSAKNFTPETAVAAGKIKVSFTVNGSPVSLTVPCHYTLLDVLRYELGYTGTKEGCGMGECGACTVIMDGEVIASCLALVTTLEGRKITTIEGLRDDEKAKPIIDAFIRNAAVQCGFCTPGMVVASYVLLKKHRRPTKDQILEGLSGNLCRCTGYVRIVDAVNEAAAELSK